MVVTILGAFAWLENRFKMYPGNKMTYFFAFPNRLVFRVKSGCTFLEHLWCPSVQERMFEQKKMSTIVHCSCEQQ